jgi:5'-methylthioadenosine phosphorylase
MRVGIITGSGAYALPGLEHVEAVAVDTPYGPVPVARAEWSGVEVVHISRHLPGHARLSSAVNHRANIWAMRDQGAGAVVGCTACGAVDPTLELGSLVIFDDLHFAANRLPDGSLCTFFDRAGDPDRGHWILHGGPFSQDVRSALIDAAIASGHAFQAGGTYGHVDGPRFNTPAEIAQLAGAGVAAVSQTGGPETVLCGELELPFALIGFVTDYANEVVPGESTPVATLIELMGRSPAIFADVLGRAVGRLAGAEPQPAGTMYRFEQR